VDYTRRLARVGDKIIYRVERLANNKRIDHIATIVDLTEALIWLDDGTFLLRGLEYDLVDQEVWIR
jgi:hypothetical protein